MIAALLSLRAIARVAPFVEEQYRELEAMMGAELMNALIVDLVRLLSLPLANGGLGGGAASAGGSKLLDKT